MIRPTYTAPIYEPLGVLTGPLHRIGFFEIPIYISVMTVLALGTYAWARRRITPAGIFGSGTRLHRILRHASYFSACWLAANASAVAIKTTLVAELDYGEPVWWEGLLPPIHLCVASASAVYVWLAMQTRLTVAFRAGLVYVQLVLVAGYGLMAYRIGWSTREDALRSVLLLLLLVPWNMDIVKRGRALDIMTQGDVRPRDDTDERPKLKI